MGEPGLGSPWETSGPWLLVLGKKGAPVATAEVSLGEDPADLGPELQRVFGELKAGLEASGAGSTEGASVHLALLPPLADARLDPLPTHAEG